MYNASTLRYNYFIGQAKENTMYAIQIHGGFMIKAYVEAVTNCSVTSDIAQAQKFPTEAAAKKFIVAHHGDGTNKATNKVIPA